MPTWIDARSCCASCALHFHLAAFGKAEQRARAGADDLADLDVARENQPGSRRDRRPAARSARASRQAAPGRRGPAHRRRRGRPSWSRSPPSRRSRGPGAQGRAHSSTAQARRRLSLPRSAQPAAPPAAPATERSTTASTWPARTQLPASTRTRTTRPPCAGDPDRLVALGAERAAGGDDSADLAPAGNDDRHRRHLSRRPRRRRGASLAAVEPRAVSKARPTMSRARPQRAPMITIRRRRRERSTTTSVSEEWIEVSRFMLSCPNCPVCANPRR